MQFKEPIIIDKTILDILSRINDNINILIITKFNRQYNKLLTVKYSNKFHDRFIIIEDKRHLDLIKEII